MITVGSKNVNDIKYGNTQILRVYKGSQLVWERVAIGTVLLDSANVGTYAVEIKVPGFYEIIAVGGGGGSAGSGGGGKNDTSNNNPVNPINGA